METNRMLKCDVCSHRFWEISVASCPNCGTKTGDGFETELSVPESQLSLKLLQRKHGFSKGNELYAKYRNARDESAKEYSDLDTLPFDELPNFTISTGRIAVGDPVMGMVELDVSHLKPGLYKPKRGAFTQANKNLAEVAGTPLICCDGPYVIIIDASKHDELVADFQQEPDVALWNSRLNDLSRRLGVTAAFYWSVDLVGHSVEGSYLFDLSLLHRAD